MYNLPLRLSYIEKKFTAMVTYLEAVLPLLFLNIRRKNISVHFLLVGCGLHLQYYLLLRYELQQLRIKQI